MHYSLVSNGDDANITVFVPGNEPPVLVAHNSHPQWERIVEGVLADDENVIDLFDLSVTAAKRFDTLSERISVQNGTVYVDGDAVHNALAKQIVRFIEDNENDWQPLVNFFENILANPNAHSREQLYEWLDRRDFTITGDGLLVGYKGVRKLGDGSLVSISSGPAIVDGEAVNGHVPNEVGSTVEIARSTVHHDPSVGCSTGLHVGTWDYASGFAQGAVLKVEVNPRDVVSVPTDCNAAKVRCCRYEVIDVIDAPVSGPVERDEDYLAGSPEFKIGDTVYDPDGDPCTVIDVLASGDIAVSYPDGSYSDLDWGPEELSHR